MARKKCGPPCTRTRPLRLSSRIFEGNRAKNGLGQHRGIFGRASHRKDEHIGTKAAEFGGQAALGICLKIQERPGNRGARAQSEQNHEEPRAMREKKAAYDTPKHRAIVVRERGHHSPRKIGAGSYWAARRKGRALPSKVTHAARASTATSTRNDGSGAAPKTLSPRMRARIRPSE